MVIKPGLFEWGAAMNTKKAKILVVLFFLFSFFPVSLWAGQDDIIIDSPPAIVESELVNDIALLSSYAVIDYLQSVEMFFNNTGYHEVNPILGKYPSREDMLMFGGIGIAATVVLGSVLPDTWRRIVLDSIIATEQLTIEDNRKLAEGWSQDGPPIRGRTMKGGIPIVISLRY